MQLKKITLSIIIFFTCFCAICQEYADKIDEVLDNNLAETRGKLTEENGVHTLFYFDTFEKDSSAKLLQEKGHHGGGPSWLAMIYAAFNIYEENILDSVKYEVSVSGLTIKSGNKEDLLMIGKVIALIKSDQTIMDALIEEAKKLDIMK